NVERVRQRLARRDERLERSRERLSPERAPEPGRAGDVGEARLLADAIEEPHPLLLCGERDERRASGGGGARDRPPRAPRPVDPPREREHGAGLEELPDSDLD